MTAAGPHLSHSLGLDLSNALARNRQAPSHLFKCVRTVGAQAVTQAHHLSFPIGQRGHRPFHFVGKLAADGRIFRRFSVRVGQQALWMATAITEA